MTHKILLSISFAVAFFALLSFDVAKGWYKAGSDPKKYEMGIDKGAGRNGKNAATIRSSEDEINGFGTLMQSFLPDKYKGKRIRMTGYMKSRNVKDWAGFWLRVDGKDAVNKGSLSFDNMEDRAVTGNSGWKKYAIVLDVPDQAVNISFGALLSGTGQIWFTDINFDLVGKDVAITGSGIGRQKKLPTNLNFEN